MKLRIKEIVWNNKDIEIKTPNDLREVVETCLQNGMVICSINGKEIYDRSKSEFRKIKVGGEIKSIGFTWR